MDYNRKYFNDGILWQLRPKLPAINTYETSDGIIIGMFQGARGERPDIDFVVKVLLPGENETPFSPPHTFWVVDLLLKIKDYREEVKEILNYYLSFYENLKPFDSPYERMNYRLRTKEYICDKYKNICQDDTLSLEYITSIVELFCLNEKRNTGAYMFRNLLESLLKYTKREANYLQVIQSSRPGFR